MSNPKFLIYGIIIVHTIYTSQYYIIEQFYLRIIDQKLASGGLTFRAPIMKCQGVTNGIYQIPLLHTPI